VVHLGAEQRAVLAGIDLAEIAITSALTVSDVPPPAGAFTLPDVPGVAVVAGKAGGTKCERCWRVLPEVGSVAGHETVCVRCADAVEHRLAAIG
jgi:isoleucyl-tRNA synthetase